MAQDVTKPDPTLIMDLLIRYRQSKTMFAAVALGVFDALAEKPWTAADLSERLQLNADAAERLLDACVGLGLLDRDGDRYANTPAAAVYLCATSPERLTGYINFSNQVGWNLWSHLEDAVREGTNRWKQAYGWDAPIFSFFFKDDFAKREFLMGMNGQGLISSPQVVSAFDLSRFTRLIDLGGATGHLAIAACRRYPNLQAVLFDLPEAVPLARELIAASGVGDRVEIVAGDFFHDALPAGDLFALGRIVHDWAEPKIISLLERVRDRLPAGGGLLLAEKLLAADRSGPPWAQMQNLNMLTCTEGKERTLAEYEDLLIRAGFRDVQGCATASPLDAILAVKA